MNIRSTLFTLFIIAFIIPTPIWACTIFCAKDNLGHMWAGNNEDFYYFDFSTWINVAPKTDSTLSYLYFGYGSTNFPQGGINEAGLFYDGNAIEATEIMDANKKIPFPKKREHSILFFLGHCKTVPEVIELFGKYKIPWMINAQLNLADKEGNMGIITADSAWLTKGNIQVSTNYNLSHNDDDYKKCWRYPVAHSMLSNSDPSFELLTRICDSTSQRNGASTIYSNVHNLTTGEIWLYYGWDYKNPYKTTFGNLIAMGDTVIMFRDLFAHQTVSQAYKAFSKEGFNAGLEILNSINDPLLREQKLKLLSLNALFEFDAFLESGKITITKDDDLIHQIIKASNNEEILSIVAKQNVSKKNKEFAELKLNVFQKSGIRHSLILWLIFVGGILSFLIYIVKKITKRHQTIQK